MIRVELLGRQRRWSPWSKALLSALVVCGGLYGIHLFFPSLAGSLFSADSTFSPAAQQEQEDASSPVVQREIEPKPTAQEAAPSPVVQQESTPEPTAQQEAASSPVGQQEITPKSAAQRDTVPSPVAQQEATPSPVVQQESTKPVAEQEATPKPVVAQQEATPSPGMQQETTPSPAQEIEPKPAAPQEVALSSAAQQDTVPSPVVQQEISSKPVAQETASSPVQEATPSPVREIAAKPEATPSPSTPSQAPSPQRSTACHQVMRIDEQVPAGIRVASLNCNSSGEYRLEGTSPSHKVLREFRLRLQTLPSRVSFSTWREERTLRFAFQGRFAEWDTSPLDALSSDQAEQFFGKVARWADASGLDSLSIHKPIHRPLSPTRSHQRQKLWGIGSPQQIDSFLQQLRQAKAVATLGEVLLLPVKSDERGWIQARLYAAVDIIVDEP